MCLQGFSSWWQEGLHGSNPAKVKCCVKYRNVRLKLLIDYLKLNKPVFGLMCFTFLVLNKALCCVGVIVTRTLRLFGMC